MSDREKEPFQFPKDAKVPKEHLDLENIFLEFIKVVEHMHVMSEWQKSIIIDQPAQREGSKITSRNLFDMPCSATCEETLRRLKEKENE